MVGLILNQSFIFLSARCTACLFGLFSDVSLFPKQQVRIRLIYECSILETFSTLVFTSTLFVFVRRFVWSLYLVEQVKQSIMTIILFLNFMTETTSPIWVCWTIPSFSLYAICHNWNTYIGFFYFSLWIYFLGWRRPLTSEIE